MNLFPPNQKDKHKLFYLLLPLLSMENSILSSGAPAVGGAAESCLLTNAG
jgi:hypothetical protein